MKKIFWLLFLIILSTNVIYADKIISGPYPLEEGLKKYTQQTGRLVYHRGSDNPLEAKFKGQCTWFSYAVTKEAMPTGHAYSWYGIVLAKGKNKVGDKPIEGAVCVWVASYAGGYGHVAKVTKVNKDGSFEIWEANYKKLQITHRLITNTSQIMGFIYADEAMIEKFKVIDCDPFNNEQLRTNQPIMIRFSNKISDEIRSKLSDCIFLQQANQPIHNFKCEIVKDKVLVIKPSDQWQEGKLHLTIFSKLKDEHDQQLEDNLVYSYNVKKFTLVSTGPDAKKEHQEFKIIYPYLNKNTRIRYNKPITVKFSNNISKRYVSQIHLFVYVTNNGYRQDSTMKVVNGNKIVITPNKKWSTKTVKIKILNDLTDVFGNHLLGQNQFIVKIVDLDEDIKITLKETEHLKHGNKQQRALREAMKAFDRYNKADNELDKLKSLPFSIQVKASRREIRFSRDITTTIKKFNLLKNEKIFSNNRSIYTYYLLKNIPNKFKTPCVLNIYLIDLHTKQTILTARRSFDRTYKVIGEHVFTITNAFRYQKFQLRYYIQNKLIHTKIIQIY